MRPSVLAQHTLFFVLSYICCSVSPSFRLLVIQWHRLAVHLINFSPVFPPSILPSLPLFVLPLRRLIVSSSFHVSFPPFIHPFIRSSIRYFTILSLRLITRCFSFANWNKKIFTSMLTKSIAQLYRYEVALWHRYGSVACMVHCTCVLVVHRPAALTYALRPPIQYFRHFQ